MLRKWTVAVALLFVCQFALAIQSPVAMLQGISSSMIAKLKANQSRLQSHPQIVRNIVKKNLLPHVDVARMSEQVVGQPWRSATATQKKQFRHLFVNFVINTYASALQSYNGDVVRFYPLRGGYKNRQAVQIRSMIVRRNGQNISVNYYLLKQGHRWNIYDFTIENVSLVQSYRAQFADTLSQGGMTLLIQRLKARS